MLAVAVVSSVFLLQFDWFGDAGSEQRGPIDTLFDVMIVLSCVVFAIVMVMFGYAIWKFRAKPGDESDGKPIHGNTKLEIAWTVIPTVIVLFGAGYSWIVLDDIEAKRGGRDAPRRHGAAVRVDLRVPGEDDRHGRRGNPGDDARAPRAGRPPARRPPDRARRPALVLGPGVGDQARPGPGPGPGGGGVDNTFVVTPDQEGTYSLVCTELCGTGHATMRATVVVESPGGLRPVGRTSRRQRSTSGGAARRVVEQRRDVGFRR